MVMSRQQKDNLIIVNKSFDNVAKVQIFWNGINK